jgi:hypothetical protein
VKTQLPRFFTKGELESVFGFLADYIGCHVFGSPARENVVSGWKEGRATYVADHLKCFPNDKREDVEDEKQYFDESVKTLEKIQRAHEQPDGLTFIYTVPAATVARMRETAKLMNIPFKTFVRIHSDVSFVFTGSTEDYSLTIGHYIWPSRAAAQKAADQLIDAGRLPPHYELDFYEGGEHWCEKFIRSANAEGTP